MVKFNRDKNNYNSAIAQIIEASGNLLNNVKDPFFVILILLLLVVGILSYRYLDILELKLGIVEPNQNHHKVKIETKDQLLD